MSDGNDTNTVLTTTLKDELILVCKYCRADLSVKNSIRRELLNEEGAPSVILFGHRDEDGKIKFDKKPELYQGGIHFTGHIDTCRACKGQI